MSKILDIIFRTRRQGDGIDQTKKGVDGVNDSAEKGKGKAAAWGRAWKDAAGMAGGAIKGALGYFKSLGELGAKSMLAVTAATIGSVREFANFNVGMSRAWTMMSVGREEFRKFRSQVVDLSAELGVAKDQLASGLYQALSASVPKDNVMSFLRTAAEVSIADGSSIEVAVDGMTTVLNAFGIEASKTEEVADKMFKTVMNGKTTFAELATSISQAAPDAQAMGVSLDELLGATATITKQGVGTSTAMVVIRNAMQGLNKELGDGWSKTKSFQEALEEVARKKNYSQNALREIFGAESLKGVNALTGANFGKAIADLKEGKNAAGSLAINMSKVQSETGHWRKLWQTILGYATKFGEEFDTKIKPTVNEVAKKLNEFRQGGTFKGFAEDFAAAAVDFVQKIIAGGATFAETVSALWKRGPAAFSAAFGVAIVELVNLGITTMLELLKANWAIFMALGKAVGSAIMGEVMKLDIPGMEGVRKGAARDALASMSAEEAAAAGLDGRLAGDRKEMLANGTFGGAPLMTRRDVLVDEALKGMSKDKLIELASAGQAGRFSGAVESGRAGTASALENVRASASGALGRISGAATTALGVDTNEIFARNLEMVRGVSGPTAEAAGAPAVFPRTDAQAMEAMRERLGMERKDVVNTRRMGANEGGKFMAKQEEDVAKVEAVIAQLESGNREAWERLHRALEKQKELNAAAIRNLPI